MILQKEIIQIAERKRLKTTTIDKDWVLGHFLNAMYSFEDIRKNFVFKGGTALKKCYFIDYRFSEDLDFTLLDKDFLVDEKFFRKVIKTATANSGIKFYFHKQKVQRSNVVEHGYEIKIKYWGADHKLGRKPLPPSRWQTYIKLDISFSEKLRTPPDDRMIFHDYSDNGAITNSVIVYSIYEIIAEKLRTLIQRNRPRDVYDINYLSELINEESFPLLKELLFQKAKHKNIEITGITDFVNERKARSNKRAWQQSLRDHLPLGELPDFDNAYENTRLFIEKILNA